MVNFILWVIGLIATWIIMAFIAAWTNNGK